MQIRTRLHGINWDYVIQKLFWLYLPIMILIYPIVMLAYWWDEHVIPKQISRATQSECEDEE